MTNVLHPHIEFGQVKPSPLGFGFGFGPSASSPVVVSSWPSSAFQPYSSNISPIRIQKRRYEPENDENTVKRKAGDDSMGRSRSPTPPERPKKAPPKRAKLEPDKSGKTPKDDDVDVGVLLASLPPQSLLPLLTALLKAQPTLKSVIIPLIPRPTVDTVIQALASSAKKLRDAYPYSASTFGFGSGSRSTSGGMRDSYIISRLTPHINDFVAACMSYLPYFSYSSNPKEKTHPSETYLFLSEVTKHIFSQPPLAQSSLAPLLLPRLTQEWQAWVQRVDEVVNQQGGMFGRETVEQWERGLDEFAGQKDVGMVGVRDLWVAKVGWLVGRVVVDQ